MAIGTLAPPMGTAAGSARTAERSRVWRKFARNKPERQVRESIE